MAEKHIWHNMGVREVLEVLKTSGAEGLGEKEARKRQKHGLNKLPEERPLSKIAIFLSQLKNPLIYILLIAGGVTLFLRETADTVVIFAAVLVNVSVGFIQELKAGNTLRELKLVLKVKAVVLRDAREKEILQEELVPGDVIILKTGAKVPADARIIEDWNLRINEAVLTGEWLANSKINKIMPKERALADRENMAFMGTIVEEGEGKAVVTATAEKTEIGKVAGLIKATKEEKTPYQKKLAHFSKIVGLVIALACLLIFIEGIWTGQEFVEMFVTAVAVAVAAIPEGLPIAMTVILAVGMQRILKRKGLVRKLASAETLGSTSIIATDKTLTLTEGRMELAVISSLDQKLTLTIAALANEAFIENPKDKPIHWKVRGRPTDKALVMAAADKGLKRPALEKEFVKLGEIAFNTQNKFIAALHQQQRRRFLFVSGAPEKLLALSSKVKKEKGEIRLGRKQKDILEKELENLTGQGLRVVAVACKQIQKSKFKMQNLEAAVKDLTFAGFIGLRDPIRKEAKHAFALCREAGMRPLIVTGDHMLTAKAVAQELGIEAGKENIMLAVELDKLSDEELDEKLNKVNVFARVEPAHKLRIIEAWQRKNKVVAMTGDGINDAPALKRADIGVALGSGTDVAKDVSDLVLLNDNFSVLVAAVEEGRAILDNIRKVITYLLSDSFTEMILVAAAVILRIPLPLTAVQILWVNLIEDGFPNIALAFEPKEKDLMKQKPTSHKTPLLTREMKAIIFIIGFLTDLILLGLFFWLYNKFGMERLAYIRTMVFGALTVDSLFYVFCCKSLRKNIWHINIFSNKYLIGAWLFGFVALMAALYLPVFQNLLKTVPLHFFDWLVLIGFGLTEFILIETAKHYFIVRQKAN